MTKLCIWHLLIIFDQQCVLYYLGLHWSISVRLKTDKLECKEIVKFLIFTETFTETVYEASFHEKRATVGMKEIMKEDFEKD